MRHDIVLEGYTYRLRPVEDCDAGFIVSLRADPALNRYLHTGAHDVAEQLAWQARYYARPGDYYFVVERKEQRMREGLVAIYDVDLEEGGAEWGRWILRSGSLAAIESAWLIYRVAFECLGLRRVYCRTVSANVSVVAFHDSCGICERRILPGHFRLGGERHDAVEHVVDQVSWPALASRLEAFARRLARKGRHV